MRKTPLVALLFILLFSAGLSAQDMAVATVRLERTEPISEKQLEDAATIYAQQKGAPLTEEEKKQLLEQMVDQALINQAAAADRDVTVTDAEIREASMRLVSQQLQAMGQLPPGGVITDENQYRQVVVQMGESVENFEAQVRNQLLAEKYISTKNAASFQAIGPASPEELEAAYSARISEFAISDSVWFEHIYFKTAGLSSQDAQAKRAKAQEVHQKLMNTSATFADLMASESEDQVSLGRGVPLGPLAKGDTTISQAYGQDFVDALFSMDIGDVSDVLKSNAGYHIVRLTRKEAARLLTLEETEVRNYLEQLIYANKFQEAFAQAVTLTTAELREKATIRYFGEYR
ncbi:MAG: peptidyl-prolyl cis-trans isomerase [Spirochaetales bacterium]|nr:peptidyl-prolyl cis-trans isomerase [Spirochaetales bacterium]